MQAYNEEIKEDNLLTTIWVKPKATLAYILNHCPDKYVPVLLCLGGITRAIDRAFAQNTGDKMSTTAILLLAIIVGGAFGWLTYYVYAWGLSTTGRWINGNASSTNFRTVIAWALIPSIASLLLLVPQVLIFGDDLFKSEPANQSELNGILWITFSSIEVVLGIWSVIILVKGTALIQSFSSGKAFLNVILPGLIVLSVLGVLVIAFKVFE